MWTSLRHDRSASRSLLYILTGYPAYSKCCIGDIFILDPHRGLKRGNELFHTKNNKPKGSGNKLKDSSHKEDGNQLQEQRATEDRNELLAL